LNGILKCKHSTPVYDPYFLSGADQIAVEIIVRCDGVDKLVSDVFTMKTDNISFMRVYSGQAYRPN